MLRGSEFQCPMSKLKSGARIYSFKRGSQPQCLTLKLRSSAPRAVVRSLRRYASWRLRTRPATKAFAATIKSKNKKHVHRRDPAAAMVSAAIGAPYSGELLRRSACPFVVISRIAYYAEDDLRALAESILDNAVLRRGTPDKRRRRVA